MFTPNLIYSTKLQPHTQQFLLSFDVDTQNQEYGFIDDATVLPDLKVNTVKVNDGVDRIQWPFLPLNNLLHDGVSVFLRPAPARHPRRTSL